MQSRFVTAAGFVLAAACLAACSSSAAPNPPSAAVTINGIDALQTHAVKCTQLQWTWMINVGDTASGATITVDPSNETPTTTAVHITNVGGFSGIYSQNNGAADTRVSGETFTIAGTANGVHTDTWEPTSARYKIVAQC